MTHCSESPRLSNSAPVTGSAGNRNSFSSRWILIRNRPLPQDAGDGHPDPGFPSHLSDHFRTTRRWRRLVFWWTESALSASIITFVAKTPLSRILHHCQTCQFCLRGDEQGIRVTGHIRLQRQLLRVPISERVRRQQKDPQPSVART